MRNTFFIVIVPVRKQRCCVQKCRVQIIYFILVDILKLCRYILCLVGLPITKQCSAVQSISNGLLKFRAVHTRTLTTPAVVSDTDGISIRWMA